MKGKYFQLELDAGQAEEAQNFRELGFAVNSIMDTFIVEYFATPDEVHLHKELGKLGVKHLRGPLGLELMEFDPIARPDQRIVQVSHPVSPEATLDTISAYASVALNNDETGRFDELVEGFLARDDIIKRSRQDIADGKNTVDVTEHTSLHGGAVFKAAKLVALNNPDYIRRNIVVVSKLVSRLKAFGLPATDVLNHIGDIYSSIPRTDSIMHSGISKETAETLNRPMLHAIGQRLAEGADAVIAPSGGIDQQIKENELLIRILMQRMSSGTGVLLSQFERMLPGAVWLDAPSGQPWFWIGDITDEVYGRPEAAHGIMELIASELSLLAGVPAAYRKDRGIVGEAAHDVGERIIRKAGSLAHHLTERIDEVHERY